MTEYKLLVTRLRGRIVSVLWDGKRPAQWTVDEDRPDELPPGGIYVGRIKNIVKNINAAFVEIAPGKMCYLSLEHSERAAVCGASSGGPGAFHADGQLHAGDLLIVQVEREAIKTKQAAVTAEFNLAGKYAVLVHGKSVVGVSSKIADAKRRAELKELFSGRTGENYGWIVRTNAASVSPEELVQEAQELLARYERIMSQGVHRAAFSVLEEPEPPYLSLLKESYSGQITEILTDDRAIWSKFAKCLGEPAADSFPVSCGTGSCSKKTDGSITTGGPALRLCGEELSLARQYSLEKHLADALNPRVWLKSGASLVIEPTEALTVIDVNTGKAVKERGRREEHFLKINLEAAGEIARQIRLRNLSGIIVVDFIGMENESSRQELLARFGEQLAQDPVRTVLVGMTPLQLVEITRKKVRRPLHEEFRAGNGQGGREW
ncbi:MAG: ribonuclease E/G [Lachnospiraceae bacterium]|nr:ribonuclease E/G [Lachnospiraceae bacterium]